MANLSTVTDEPAEDTFRWIYHGREADPADPGLGGKARALAALGNAYFPIPLWFVIMPEAFYSSLTTEMHDAMAAAKDADALRSAVATVHPSPTVAEELHRALAELCPVGQLVAVRSSAVDEDGAEHSFAGQLDSYLYVTADKLEERVGDVWRSGFGERLLAYRKTNNLSMAPSPPAVLIQRMIDCDTSGVAFGADPISGRRSIAVIGALYGAGTALVSGECDADTYHVNLSGEIVHNNIATKATMHRMGNGSGEGVLAVPVESALQSVPALTDGQVRAVSRLVRRAGRYFGRHQDIEWAIKDEQVYLLQSRPITSLAAIADPDAPITIWDNSNIVESYSGITTPLTFTFARRAYEEVYREFCRLLSVPNARVEAADTVFSNMLGLVRGRVYYNLLNWYRVLALLPGFTVNRRFMEQMMGVREELPDEISIEISPPTLRDRIGDWLAFTGSLGGLIRSHWTLPVTREDFLSRLNTALAPPDVPLHDMRLDQLAAHYTDLERLLLRKWDAPLINDFLAMIFYGTLGKLVVSWCSDIDGTLQNDLLCGEGGMVSAEPAHRIREMADIAAKQEDLAHALTCETVAQIKHRLRYARPLRKELRAYLAKFGDRCLEELKLETATLEDEPLPLLRSIGQLALRIREGGAPAKRIDAEIRQRAEQRAGSSLKGRPIRHVVFHWVLKHARGRVRDRENLRFERTRVFGQVRRIFIEMGRRLNALNLIDHPRDVFYMELQELLGIVQGTATTMDIRGLVELRKAEYETYQNEAPPPERFQTRGFFFQPIPLPDETTKNETDVPQSDEIRKGLGCCPGVVCARVRVIRDPRGAVLLRGEILVAERTDPGWIMLFPSAAGVLVERGSLLSHSAIVSREMGIPSIVSIPGLLQWLNDGDLIEMDGARGLIRRVSLDATEQVGNNEH